jgi:hypothetical protein
MRVIYLFLFMFSLLICSGGCGESKDVIAEPKTQKIDRESEEEEGGAGQMSISPDMELDT